MPEIHRRAPDLTRRHALTLLAILPDLREVIAVSAELERWLPLWREGHPRRWTLQLAHGLVDLLLDWAARAGGLAIEFDNARAADSLDRELLAVLARRGEGQIAVRVTDGEADALPVDTAADAARLLARSQECMRLAFYQASLDFAERGLAVAAGDRGASLFAELGRNRLFSLLLLGRFDEVERYCDEVRARNESDALRSHCAYAMAILNVRLYPAERRDLSAARRFVEEALALTETAPPSEGRIVRLVFLHNTLALVEMRSGSSARAVELLTDGLARLAREAPARYSEESVVLFHNRARLFVSLGEPARALEDLALLLAQEPSNAAAWLDRGVLHQRAGRFAEALHDCDRAIEWSPPHEQAFYNRAQALAALGRDDEALAAHLRVLDLAPEHHDARLNRAGIFFRRGDPGSARAEIDLLLRIDPDHAKGLSLLGLIESQGQRWDDAQAAFDRAIARDPSEPSAWINRATLACRRGDYAGALGDLDRALALRADPAAFFNRARIHHAQRRWREAIADYSRALEAGGDAARIGPELERCRARS